MSVIAAVGDACVQRPTEWVRLDHERWTIFLRAGARDGYPRATHAHHDLAHVVVFCDGTPLLVDVGRLDYTASPEGMYGRTCWAHNAPVVDDLGPTADGPSWLAPDYARVSAHCARQEDATASVVRIEHDGFRRLAANPIRHERLVTATSTEIQIEDRFQSRGAHRVTTRFHFGDGVSWRTDREWSAEAITGSFIVDPLMTATLRQGAPDLPGGVLFPSYGVQALGTTIETIGEFAGALTLRYRLRLHGQDMTCVA